MNIQKVSNISVLEFGGTLLKERLNNILILSVTLFLSACSVTDKLDQNLSELHTMNQNMVEMNKNMNKNMEEANKNFASLVATMKPDEWIDHISNRFDETLAKMMEGTGDPF